MRRIPATPRPVIRTAFYAHPPEKVWTALIDHRKLSQWLLPTTTDIKPEPGFRFRFTPPDSPPSGTIDCEVVEATPGHHLAFTWQSEPDQPPTYVTWTLEPTEGGTLLHLVHTGPTGPTNALTGASGRLGSCLDGVLFYGGFRYVSYSLCGGKFSPRRAVVRYLLPPAQRSHHLRRAPGGRHYRERGRRPATVSGKAG